ncbi:glyoxalase [Labedella phragmitis]|uniref:Glyoxalase n=1 Tax=Labedella phragmitis TaxID=2498849 RepID=A0A444PZD4_9MICO|nr:VOC family protein [Labedella phragmitis]RWZ53238.1 glyoxalase [Labedella phragmitis]
MDPHTGGLHHVELWVPDLDRASVSWGWLLRQLGWSEHERWSVGRSWILGATYLVVEQSPAMTDSAHERTRPGLNHLAFQVGSRTRVDELSDAAPDFGWHPLFADRYPWAGGSPGDGGSGHYAAYLEDADGYEVELVAAATASSE